MGQERNWRRKFRDAGRGIGFAVRAESTMRVHVAAAVVVIAAAVLLGVSPDRLAILVLACALVMAMECVNTAFEVLIKGHVAEPSEFAGRALDVSAGAVLVASIGAAVVGILIIGERILVLVRRAGIL
jgi:diacylglycerol kinase